MSEVQHISGNAGGFLVGNSHANGGIKAINKSIGKPLEMEGGEVVITKPAVDDGELREFEGKMLTNRQILSQINESGGGVLFAELGAELPTELYCSGTEYKYGGETLSDYEITHRISKCGCDHDKLEDGGEVEKEKWHEFTTDTGLIGAYRFEANDFDFSNYREVCANTKIKLLTKVGKTHYYSASNELGNYFDENIFPKLIENNFKYGGELNKDKINLEPETIGEFKASLNLAIHNELDKKTISNIQSYFFKFVQENPHKLLSKYYEAIEILPKPQREYFQYVVSGIDDDFQEKLHENPYNILPETLKKTLEVKKIDFSPTPKSENLGKIMNNFTAEDALRPKLCGVYFNVKEERIEATNAHILMFINEKPHVSESMICLMGKRKDWYIKKVNEDNQITENNEGCWKVDESYVDSSRIIPTDFDVIIEIDAKKILQYLNAAHYFSNETTQSIIICYKKEGKPIYRGFNYNFLSTCIKGMLMIGHDELEICFMEAQSRPACIIPKGNSRKVSGYGLKTDLALVMPHMLHHPVYNNMDDFSAVYDIENNIPTFVSKYDETYHDFENIDEPIIEVNESSKSEDNTKNIEATINGLEILLESAKGRNKINISNTINGLRLLLEPITTFEIGGVISNNLTFKPIETPL